MAEENPSTTEARMAELIRRMGWCVTDTGGAAHRQADEIMAQAAELLPSGGELARLYERVRKYYGDGGDWS